MDHLTPYELGVMVGTIIGNTAVGTGVMLLFNAALKKLGKCQSYHTILIVMVLLPHVPLSCILCASCGGK